VIRRPKKSSLGLLLIAAAALLVIGVSTMGADDDGVQPDPRPVTNPVPYPADDHPKVPAAEGGVRLIPGRRPEPPDGVTSALPYELCWSQTNPLKGECRPGYYPNVDGVIARLECLDEIGPESERCDGLDRDCNGIPSLKRDLRQVFAEGFAAAHDDKGHFFVTADCEEAFSGRRFQTVTSFRNGRALVRDDDGYLIITERGDDAPGRQRYRDIWPPREGFSLARQDDDFLFLTAEGLEAFPGWRFDNALDFDGGLAPVRRNGAWYFIAKDGTEAFPGKRFETASAFFGGQAWVSQNGRMFMIDRSGYEITYPESK